MNQVTLQKSKTKSKSKTKEISEYFSLPKRQDILYTLLLLICQRASVLGGFPFGCAAFSALGNIKVAYLSIPALIIGAISVGAPVMKYIMSALIIQIYKLYAPEKKRTEILQTAVCCGALFVCGMYYVFSSDSPAYSFALLTAEVTITAIACPVFSRLSDLQLQLEKNQPVSRENAVSVVIVLAVAMWGLSGIILPFSISPKAIAGIYLILCMVMYSSIPVAVCFSLACGFICTQSTPEALTLSGIYAISTLFSGLLKYFGHIGAAIGFLTGITVSVLMIGNITALPSLKLLDIILTAIAFACIPLKLHQRTGIFLSNTFRPEMQRRDFRIKDYITEELNCFSNTFSEYARQFKSTFQKACGQELLPSDLYDDVSARICVDCSRCSDCWQKNFNDTYKYMFSIFEITEATGRCDIHNAPIVFTQRCIQPELFLNEFNHVYEMKKISALRQGEQRGERHLVSNQYSEISKIINELSEEIEESFFFDEHTEKTIISQCQKEGIYLKDINVIKNAQGHYEMFFSASNDNDIEKITDICGRASELKLKRVFCKNQSIIKLTEDNLYYVTVSVSQKKKDDEQICGDTLIHFETDKSKYYIILCDGMGSGTDASRESRMTCELLGGFLKAGFSKHTALSLINSTLALKMDREGFSTIDLCEIDLRTGECEFIKIGGAQSFLKIDGECDTISAKGLPAGILEDIDTDNIKRTLEAEDMIVMASDGVCEVGYGMMRGEWIKRLMRLEGLEDDELASTLVNSARKKAYPKTPDDMTAAVIRLHRICE